VLDVDYLEKTVTLDKALPAKLLDGQFFEVGAHATKDHAAHWTTFEAVKLEPKDGKTILCWRKGADVYTGKVNSIQIGDDSATVTVEIAAPLIPGENSQLTLTDDKMTHSWKCDVETRADYIEEPLNGVIRLYDPGFKRGDLKAGERIMITPDGASGGSSSSIAAATILVLQPE